MAGLSCLKQIAITLVSVALVSGGPPPGVGYLARMGPTPLRFQVISTAELPPVLPPLKMSDDPSDTPAEPVAFTDEPAEPIENPPQNAASGSGLQPGNGIVSTNVTSSPLVMVPQMLMRHFAPATNRHDFISVPVEFTPPEPPIARGSTATYISQ